MKIAIAKVTKEVNSTYKPSIIESDFLEVRLKDRTSLLTPTFDIYNTDITGLSDVNYVVAKEFNTYKSLSKEQINKYTRLFRI